MKTLREFDVSDEKLQLESDQIEKIRAYNQWATYVNAQVSRLILRNALG